MSKPIYPLLAAVVMLIPMCAFAIEVITDPTPEAPAKHGMEKLVAALKDRGISIDTAAKIQDAQSPLLVAGTMKGDGLAAQLVKGHKLKAPQGPESLLIHRLKIDGKDVLLLAGSDARGLMYAELDTADRISWTDAKDDPFKEVHDISESPDCPERAVSIYTMQRAYFEQRLYDAHYWDKYFDLLAQDRFNGFVLIFGYENGGFLAPPYPYFFDVEGFDDVRMVGITPEQQKKNLDALNRLIQQAHDRGIDVTIGIWDHIYRGGVQANGVVDVNALQKPTPGLVWGVTEKNLVPYTKAALTKFLRQVHGIDAIQFRMHDESGLKNSEQAGFWAEIARLMQKEAPNIRFDARAKGLPDAVIDDILSTGIPFRVDTKYWMEQMGMPWHPTHINPQDQQNRRHSYADLLRYPKRYKMHWRLWNGGTSRILLWGDPDYVRRFVESTHLYDGDGFEINEPLCTKMQGQAQDVTPFDLLNSQYKYTEYEFERYWYFFQLFGRLGYNPNAPSEAWNREFERHLGRPWKPIQNALHQASWVLPRIVGACYPYSAFPMTRGWAERQTLGDLPHYSLNQGSDVAIFESFDEEAENLVNDTPSAKIRPQETSVWLTSAAQDIRRELEDAKRAMGGDDNSEFHSTVTDLNIIADLAKFHSERSQAALAYRLWKRTNGIEYLDEAIKREQTAVAEWKRLVSDAGDVYTNDLMFGARRSNLCGHWSDEVASLEKGLLSLKAEQDEARSSPANATTRPAGLVFRALHPAQKPSGGGSGVIDHTPVTSLPGGEALHITARLPGPIRWIRVRYRSVNQRLDYDTIAMKATGKNDEYEAVIPADKISSQFDLMYYIEAVNSAAEGKHFPDPEKQTPYVIVRLHG